jgi:hypothetical protein
LKYSLRNYYACGNRDGGDLADVGVEPADGEITSAFYNTSSQFLLHSDATKAALPNKGESDHNRKSSFMQEDIIDQINILIVLSVKSF